MQLRRVRAPDPPAGRGGTRQGGRHLYARHPENPASEETRRPHETHDHQREVMNLEHEREEADRWISETASVLGDTVRAQGALRAVLLAMRDSLTIPEA